MKKSSSLAPLNTKKVKNMIKKHKSLIKNFQIEQEEIKINEYLQKYKKDSPSKIDQEIQKDQERIEVRVTSTSTKWKKDPSS